MDINRDANKSPQKAGIFCGGNWWKTDARRGLFPLHSQFQYLNITNELGARLATPAMAYEGRSILNDISCK